MDKDIDRFLAKLDCGRFADEQGAVAEMFNENLGFNPTPKAAACAAAEYAREIAHLTIAQYHEWLQDAE